MGNSFDYVWRVLWSYRCGAVEAGLDLASVDEDLWEYRLNEGSTSSQTYHRRHDQRGVRFRPEGRKNGIE